MIRVFSWFEGVLLMVYNCLDRNVYAGKKNKVAYLGSRVRRDKITLMGS